MHGVVQKSLFVVVALVTISLMTGCTNWKKKYEGAAVENQNLKGLYQNAEAEKARLAAQLAQEQAMIDELQRKIASGKQTPAQATGFEGTGGDVSFDAAAGTVTVTLPDSILFDSGKVDLKKNTSLGKILAVINAKYNGKMIDVIGNTDSDPIKRSKWTDNWQLSTERALAVARYFMKNGIDDENVRAVGRGPSAPIADNKTSAGKAKNRRVEIVVHIKSQQNSVAAAAPAAPKAAKALKARKVSAEQPK
jgi:chemotaxis protein MotB